MRYIISFQLSGHYLKHIVDIFRVAARLTIKHLTLSLPLYT